MNILLDIDGTLLINDKLHPRHKELLQNHTVVLYSSDEEWGQYYSRKFNIPFLHKDTDRKIKADVLIDDYVFLMKNDPSLEVTKFYESIDDFFNNKEVE